MILAFEWLLTISEREKDVNWRKHGEEKEVWMKTLLCYAKSGHHPSRGPLWKVFIETSVAACLM